MPNTRELEAGDHLLVTEETKSLPPKPYDEVGRVFVILPFGLLGEEVGCYPLGEPFRPDYVKFSVKDALKMRDAFEASQK